MSSSRSNLLTFLKRSLETPGSTDADVPYKKKRNKDDKKKYEAKHLRQFQPSWQKECEWVCYKQETNKMHSSTCRKYPELADKSSNMYIGCGDGSSRFQKEMLTAHLKSRHYVVCHTRLLNDQKPEDGALENIPAN